MILRADQLRYDQAEDLAVAQGRVRVSFEGSSFTGPEVQLKLQRMEGVVREPELRGKERRVALDRVRPHADRVGPGAARLEGGGALRERDGFGTGSDGMRGHLPIIGEPAARRGLSGR